MNVTTGSSTLVITVLDEHALACLPVQIDYVRAAQSARRLRLLAAAALEDDLSPELRREIARWLAEAFDDEAYWLDTAADLDGLAANSTTL